MGRRVLVVDLDPQGCPTFSLGHDPDRQLSVSVHEVLLGEAEIADALRTNADGAGTATVDLAAPRRCC